jgi:hypothetical protein
MSFLAKLPPSLTYQHLKQELEKFKQETEYVCLKVGAKDWSSFLTDVRIGLITRKDHNNLKDTAITNSTLQPTQLPFPDRHAAQPSFDAMFN